jgi:carbamoyl-phosphate synthase large subunit
MRKVLICGAGGSASTNYVRSLRIAPEKFHIIGVDSNKFYLQRAETDERYLVPRADSPNYIPELNKIIAKTGAEFLHAQNDAEVNYLSENRDKMYIKTFLPPDKVVKICQNKWASSMLWQANDIPHPKTYLLEKHTDLNKYFLELNGPVWIRDTVGAGGRGSLKTSSFKEALDWVDYNKGWGRYTIAEYLSERSTTFTTIWKDGVLIAGQGRKRLYWELGAAFKSGVSGATGAGAVDNDPIVADMGIKMIKAIDPEPHGIYSADMTYGQDGKPYPTEINIGRFFTTHLFFAKAGFNMALIYTRLGLGDKVSVKKINPLKEGLVWIRGMDFEPILTTMDKIDGK